MRGKSIPIEQAYFLEIQTCFHLVAYPIIGVIFVFMTAFDTFEVKPLSYYSTGGILNLRRAHSFG